MALAQAKRQGDEYLQMMEGVRPAPTTTFLEHRALAENGWDAAQHQDHTPTPIVIKALSSLGFSTDATNYTTVTADHAEEGWTRDAYESIDGRFPAGTPYDKTCARYQHQINVEEGVLITAYNHGPDDVAKEINHREEKKLPPLRARSDVVWLCWQQELAKHAGWAYPRLWIETFPSDFRTARVIQDILKYENAKRTSDALDMEIVPEWPGLVYDISDGNVNLFEGIGRAILGTPAGKTMVHFFAQHMGHLGKRIVPHKVHLFHTRPSRYCSVAFSLIETDLLPYDTENNGSISPYAPPATDESLLCHTEDMDEVCAENEDERMGYAASVFG